MFWTFVNGKIYQLNVTELRPKYSRSSRICPELLAAAGFESFEMVEIYSLTDTVRIATYVFPGATEGAFTLNGGAALHFRLGDRVDIVAYRQEESFSGANCVIVDPLDNSVAETLRCDTATEAFVPAMKSKPRVAAQGGNPGGKDGKPCGTHARLAIVPVSEGSMVRRPGFDGMRQGALNGSRAGSSGTVTRIVRPHRKG